MGFTFRGISVTIRAMSRWRAVVVVAALGACQAVPTDPGTLLRLPDTERDGAEGNDGARGAAWVEFTGQARITERLLVQVVYPARADGTLDRAGAPYPSVVFVQGAGVGRERYHWLALHLATRGYVVLLPQHLFALSILDTDNAILSLAAAREVVTEAGTLHGAIAPTAPAVVMGHDVGGLIAARQWRERTDFLGVALLAAYPQSGDMLSARATGSVLAITGTADTLSPPARVRDAWLAIGPTRDPLTPRAFAVVEALNHYAWTDSPEDNERANDGPRPDDARGVRANALAVLDAWLDATLRGSAEGRALLDRNDFRGVTVYR